MKNEQRAWVAEEQALRSIFRNKMKRDLGKEDNELENCNLMYYS